MYQFKGCDYRAKLVSECPCCFDLGREEGPEATLYTNSPLEEVVPRQFDCSHMFEPTRHGQIVCQTPRIVGAHMERRLCPVFWEHQRLAEISRELRSAKD